LLEAILELVVFRGERVEFADVMPVYARWGKAVKESG
jgi:hypothetical protein